MDTLKILIVSAILGMVGQGVRAAIGLKSSATLAAQGATEQSEFDAAYFFISLMIGGIAGIAAEFVLQFPDITKIDKDGTKTLLAIIASGYAGTDFIENAFTNILPTIKQGTVIAAPSVDPPVSRSAAEVKTSANATRAIIASIQATYDKLGMVALTDLQKAVGDQSELKSLFSQATSAWTAMSTQVQRLPDCLARANALLALPNGATSSDIQAAYASATGLADTVHSINDAFTTALAQFQQTRGSILKSVAQG